MGLRIFRTDSDDFNIFLKCQVKSSLRLREISRIQYSQNFVTSLNSVKSRIGRASKRQVFANNAASKRYF